MDGILAALHNDASYDNIVNQIRSAKQLKLARGYDFGSRWPIRQPLIEQLMQIYEFKTIPNMFKVAVKNKFEATIEYLAPYVDEGMLNKSVKVLLQRGYRNIKTFDLLMNKLHANMGTSITTCLKIIIHRYSTHIPHRSEYLELLKYMLAHGDIGLVQYEFLNRVLTADTDWDVKFVLIKHMMDKYKNANLDIEYMNILFNYFLIERRREPNNCYKCPELEPFLIACPIRLNRFTFNFALLLNDATRQYIYENYANFVIRNQRYLYLEAIENSSLFITEFIEQGARDFQIDTIYADQFIYANYATKYVQNLLEIFADNHIAVSQNTAIHIATLLQRYKTNSYKYYLKKITHLTANILSTILYHTNEANMFNLFIEVYKNDPDNLGCLFRYVIDYKMEIDGAIATLNTIHSIQKDITISMDALVGLLRGHNAAKLKVIIEHCSELINSNLKNADKRTVLTVLYNSIYGNVNPLFDYIIKYGLGLDYIFNALPEALAVAEYVFNVDVVKKLVDMGVKSFYKCKQAGYAFEFTPLVDEFGFVNIF